MDLDLQEGEKLDVELIVGVLWRAEEHTEDKHLKGICKGCKKPTVLTKGDKFAISLYELGAPLYCVKCAIEKMDSVVETTQQKERLTAKKLHMKYRRGTEDKNTKNLGYRVY